MKSGQYLLVSDEYCPFSYKYPPMRRKINFILILFGSFLFQFSLSAQWLEAGVTIGTSNYLGDLVEDDIAPNEYNLAYGVFGRYQMSKYISVKGYLNHARISGTDANNRTNNGLRQRNLSFRTDIIELGVVNEISITPYDPIENKNALPYVFVGISGFYFNPQAEFEGEYHNLRPLGTEGQGNVLAGSSTYSAISFAVPFGLGFKWNINPMINIGAEFGFRITATDYLDDVSDKYPNLALLSEQNPLAASLSFRADEFNSNLDFNNAQGGIRGNPDNVDWFFVAGINISVNLTNTYGMEWDKKRRAFLEEPVPQEEGKQKRFSLRKIKKHK